MTNLEKIRIELETYEDTIINTIKKRIHLGIEVAKEKSKIIDKNKFINNNILDLITNKDVENKIIDRLKIKCKDEQLERIIIELYKNYIIPKTKEVQIDYLNKNSLNLLI